MNHPFKRFMGLLLAVLMLVSLMPMSVFAESSWDIPGKPEHLDIKGGSITHAEFYERVKSLFNNLGEEFRYSTSDADWNNAAVVEQNSDAAVALSDGTTYYVVEATADSEGNYTYSTPKHFKVRYYYHINWVPVVEMPAGCSGVTARYVDGEYVSDDIETFKVYSGQTVALTVDTSMSDYTVEVKNGNTVLLPGDDDNYSFVPTASTTITVEYKKYSYTGNQSSADDTTGWYWEDTILHIKNGSITKGKLYSALSEKFGSPENGTVLKGFFYGDQSTNVPNNSDTDVAEMGKLQHGTNVNVWKVLKTGLFETAERNSMGNITVKYYYYPTLAETGNPVVDKATFSNKVIHGDNVTVTLPQMKETGWTATVTTGTGTTLSPELSTESATVVNIGPITSAEDAVINVVYVKAASYNINVSVAPETPWGTASVNASSSIAGKTITITATPANRTNNVVYGVSGFKVNGGALITGSSFVMPEQDANVVVYFTKSELQMGAESDTDNIEFNGWYQDATKLSAEQLNALKQEIFSKLDVESLPAGATWENVTIQYYPLKVGTLSGSSEYDSTYYDLTYAKADESFLGIGYEYRNFGERAYNNGAAINEGVTEKIRITYNGLYIETDITLVEARETFEFSFNAPGLYEDWDVGADIIEKIRECCGINSNVKDTITLDDNCSLPTNGGEANLTYNINIAANEHYLASNETVTINVKAKMTARTISIKVDDKANYGTAELSTSSATDGQTVTVTATPNEGNANTRYELDYITVNGTKITGKTFEVSGDASVVVYFKMYQLTGNTTATVKFDPTKTAAEQLDALKQGIFTALGVNYSPAITDSDGDGYLWDELTYESKYWYTYTIYGGQITTKQGDSYAEIGVDPEDKDETVGYTTNHPFGYTGVGTVEHVRISYNGLYIEADITLTEGREYTVIWKNADGTVLETDNNVTHGTAPVYDGATPTKAADAQYTYTFAGWATDASVENGTDADSLPSVTGEVTYYAIFSKTVREYTVTWKNDDGTVLETDENVPYGTVPTYDNANRKGTTEALAAAKNNAQYTYTFAGWTPEVNAITGNTEYTATYSKTVNKYTITFKNGDEVLQSGEWEYGATPVYSGKTPVKAATAQHTFSFSGWDNEIKPVNGEMVYNAQFDHTVNGYTVVWQNENGTVLETDENVPYGTTPVYNAAEPTKAADENNTYTFDGWTPAVDSVKGDATYTAKFTTVAKIKVTFSVNGDTSRYTNVVSGETVTAYTTPNLDGWQFGGWYADEACTVIFDFNTPITEATAVYAKMTKIHTVSFNTMGSSTTIADQSIIDGSCAIEPATKPAKLNETFLGWYLNDVKYDFSKAVTSDIVLVAKYGADIDNDGKVDGSEEDPWLIYVWKDADGTQLHFATILSGAAMPTYTISDSTDNNKFFAGWTEAVDGYTTTYTAKWAEDINNNDVDDASETGTVTLIKEGEGNVTLAPAGKAELIKQEGNVYTYLWDSTADANKVINVVISLNDNDATDGSVDYVISAPESVNIGESVTVKFGKHVLNAKSGTIKVNQYYAEMMDKKALENLRTNILAAAGVSGDNIVITTTVGIDSWNLTATVIVNDGSVTVVEPGWGNNDTGNNLVAGLFARELYGSSRPFVITDNNTGVSKSVSMTITDSRTAATINTDSVKAEYTVNDIAALEAAIKADITAQDNSGGSIDAGSISVSVSGNKPALDGESYTATVNVSAGEDWLGATETVTVTGKLKTYIVTFVNHDGSELWSGSFGYKTIPSYGGETPVKADKLDANGNVMATYTYNKDVWEPAITAVSGEATYTATFTEAVKTYTVKYVNYDGTELKSYSVNYGDAQPQYDGEPPVRASDDPAVIYVHSGYERTSGKELLNNTVVSDMVYTATFTTEDVYTIKYVTGKKDGEWVVFDTQYINLTQNPDAVIVGSPNGNPDAANTFENKVFAGWGSKVGTSPKGEEKVIILEAVWEAEANNNNIPDRDETATVVVNVTNNNGASGKVEISGVIIAETANVNGSTVYTVIYDSTAEGGNKVTVTATADATEATEVEYYVASAPESVTVANGETTTVNVTFDAQRLVASNGTIPGNGSTVELKKASVTKEAVLKAILGEDTAFNADEYTVEMYIHLTEVPFFGTIDGYYDIWGLDSWLSAAGSFAASISNAIWERAVDIPGSESFKITWAKEGYPTVSGIYTVTMTDARPVAEASHNGDTYNAFALDDDLLKEIEADITATDGVIFAIRWGEGNPTELLEDQTYTVKVVVTLEEDEKYQGATKTIEVTVHVPVTKATITIAESANMTYNTGMTDANKVQMVLEAVKPDFHPDVLKDTEVTVWYKANSARNVPLELNLAAMDLGVFGYVLPDTVTIQIPVQDMWMNIGEAFPETHAPTVAQLEEIVIGLVEEYGADFLSGSLTEDDLYTILALTMKQNPELKLYYDYYGAHVFGENETTDENGNVLETVYVTQKDTGYGALKSNESVLTLADLRKETSIRLNTGVEVTYNAYTPEELLAALVDGVYDAEGNKVAGSESVVFVTDVKKLPASEGTDITVKYVGDLYNKGCTATATVVVNKADVSVTIENQAVKYGSDYNRMPISTDPAGVDTIQFVAGVDISGLEIDASEGVSVNAIKGLVGSVQLMLPDELQSLLEMADGLLTAAGLDISFADGASIKLSELKKSVDVLSEVLKDTAYAEYFSVLLNLVGSIPTDTVDFEIVIGGILPTNVGVYLIGAVTADANYNTAFGVGVMAITPDGYKAELDWKIPDSNGIITLPALRSGEFDTSAEVISVYEGSVEAANEKIISFFVGVDAVKQEIVFKTAQEELSTGAYAQVALIKDFGNTMYYAVPIVRAFAVVPGIVDMSFATVTDDGVIPGKDFVYTYDSEAKTPAVTVDGKVMQAGGALSVKYYGLTLKGEKYDSAKAPTQAGIYTAVALYIERDESGEIVKAGMAVAGIVIKMNGTASVEVENAVVNYTGAKTDINSLVTAKDEVEGDNAAVTVITGMVANEGDFSEIGWASIGGSVNVDFPAVLDTMLKKVPFFANAYENNAGIGVDDVIAAIEAARSAITEIGISSEAVDSVINVLEQLPKSVKVTFEDSVKVTEIGVYAVCAIVTDPNFVPAADAGLLVITPSVNQVYLKFDYEDSNNIFTQDIFEYIDLSASAYTDAEFTVKDEAATAKVTERFISIDAEGNIVTFKDKRELSNGVYIELAYIELEVGGIMTVSDVIARIIVVLPSAVEVSFEGGNEASFDYDGSAHTLGEVIVTDNEGRVVNADSDDIILTYVGINGKLDGYYGSEAPTEAGVYLVIAAYIEKSESGTIKRVGFGAGTITINKVYGEFALVETTVIYDGKSHEIDVYNPIESDYISAYLDPASGVINITLEEKTQFVYDVLKKALVELGYIADDDVYSLANILAAVDTVLEKVSEYGLDEYIGEETMSTVSEMLMLFEVMPEDSMVCINGSAPVNAGSYIYVAANISASHNTVMGMGFLTIKPREITVTMDSITKEIGEADPEFTYTVEGEVVEGHELVVNASRQEGEVPGETYIITATAEVVGGGSNYKVTVEEGQLTINYVKVEEFTIVAHKLTFTEWGETYDLKPRIEPDNSYYKDIVWESDYESVATVENGVVTAVGNGTAKITATIDGKTVECDVVCKLPVVNATVNTDGDVNIKVEDLLTNGGKPENEEDPVNRKCTVIVAFYSEGMLVSTVIKEDYEYSRRGWNVEKPEGADSVKIFVLDNTDELPPLCKEGYLEF